MRSPSEMSLIQIEITNRCPLKCPNCTRFVGHHNNFFDMTIDEFTVALESLEGYEGNIGIMGGEPTLHPEFLELMDIFREFYPDINRRQLWTSGNNWEEYHEEIHKTFLPELISYNDHSGDIVVRHQPLLVAIDEVIEDKELMFEFIDNCWVQKRWSASITPKGAYFCEVAAAMDYMFDWEYGWDVKPGWWKVKPGDDSFNDQLLTHCVNCSACLPMPYDSSDKDDVDICSPLNFLRVKSASRKIVKEADIESIRKYIGDRSATPGKERGSYLEFPEWHPWRYRNEYRHEPK